MSGARLRAIGVPDNTTPPEWHRALAVGLLIVASYLCVLAALSMAPLSIVSPLRESSVVIAAVWGVMVLHERHDARARLVGATLIGLGAALVALG